MKAGHGIDLDENGVPSVPMYRVIPAASDQKWADGRVYTCPIVYMRLMWVHDALRSYYLTKDGCVSLRDLVGEPSNAAIEAVSTIAVASAAVEADMRKEK